MITKSYSFYHGEIGELELDVENTDRQVYKTSLPKSIPFKLDGLGQYTDDNIDQLYFFEWQKINYRYTVSGDADLTPPFELRINERIEKTSKEMKSGYHALTGQFAFEDVIGQTRIEIRDSKNKLIFGLETEVFPQKMDYQSDYKLMMADISSILQNLAYDSLKDTYRRSKTKIVGNTTEHEWWNILDALFDQLITHLIVVKKQPNHKITTIDKITPVEKIKYESLQRTNWFLKNSKYCNKNKIGIKIFGDIYFSQSLSANKQVTYDTYENRFLAWAIRGLIYQLKKYKTHIETNYSKKSTLHIQQRAKKYMSLLQGVLHEPPFDYVGQFEKRSHYSGLLTRGAGYRDFLKIYLLLNRGLEITNNEIFKIEPKNISTLYEYWCFLALVKLLKEKQANELELQDLIKYKAGKYKVELAKGHKSEVTFRNNETKEKTTIYFNLEYKRDKKKIFTYSQRPDCTIKFEKKGYQFPFWYIFDAKYRFEEQMNTENNSYNVPQDAIGQLHRYRDAILHTAPQNTTYRGAIKSLGGVILYPYPCSEDEFKGNTYFKSLQEVNIGALPFLPSKTGLVGDLIDKLTKSSPEENFERFIEMDRSEYEENRKIWKDWVTISLIPKNNQNERIEFLRNKYIHYVPFVANLNSKLYLSKKILLCISGTTEGYLYEVDTWEVLSDKELHEKGATWPHRKSKYVVFHLKNELRVSTPEKIAPANFRYATNEGLTRYLNNPEKNKLYFYITIPEVARLLDELKQRGIECSIKWGDDDSDPSLVEITVKNKKILSSDKFKSMHYKLNGQPITLYQLLESIREDSYMIQSI